MPFSGNNQNYIRGKLNIDQDDLYVGGATVVNGNLTSDTTIVGSTLVISGSVDFGTGSQTGKSFRSRMTSYFEQSAIISGYLSCTMTSVNNSDTDYVGVVINTNQGQTYNTVLYIMYGSFTGIHRCFTNDELFNNDNPQLFKDNYIGRIVIESEKIATDIKNNKDDKEWNIKYDKEGITIEDALPIVQLSRKKKDKRVF